MTTPKFRIERRRRMSGAGGMPNVWFAYVIVGPDGILMTRDGSRERWFSDVAGATRAIRKLLLVDAK